MGGGGLCNVFTGVNELILLFIMRCTTVVTIFVSTYLIITVFGKGKNTITSTFLTVWLLDHPYCPFEPRLFP